MLSAQIRILPRNDNPLSNSGGGRGKRRLSIMMRAIHGNRSYPCKFTQLASAKLNDKHVTRSNALSTCQPLLAIFSANEVVVAHPTMRTTYHLSRFNRINACFPLSRRPSFV